MEKLNVALIVVVIILIGALGVSFGYMFFVKNNTTSNQTPMNITNITNVTNQTIPYSSEYITFSKAKSIAKSYAATGVVTSDPVLVKAKNGDAVYYSTYTYNGVAIGGVIINAKTGTVLVNQQDIPTQTNAQTTYTDTGNNYQDTSDQSTNDNSGDNGYSGDSGDNGYSGDSGDNGYSDDSGDDGSYN
jgi:hypothetical protein